MKSKEKTILVTGASGFIGANVCLYFNKNFNVIGLADKGQAPQDIKTVNTDLLNFKKLKTDIAKIKPNIILHLGAYVVLERDFKVALECIDNNIKGTLNLLEVARLIKPEKFLFFSTEEIYGDNKLPFKESQKVLPPSPYAISKVACENFCSLYHKLYNLPITIFRIATTYGPHQPETRFIPNIIIHSLKNKPILFNSGKNKRDYVYTLDLINAIEKFIKTKKNISGETFNIGQTRSISGKKLANTILKLTQSKSRIIFNHFPDRRGEAIDWKMDIGKTKKILNWQPKTSLEEGLKKTIEFYKNY